MWGWDIDQNYVFCISSTESSDFVIAIKWSYNITSIICVIEAAFFSNKSVCTGNQPGVPDAYAA